MKININVKLLSLAIVMVFITASMMQTNTAQMNRPQERVHDAGLLGQGGFLGTGLGSDRGEVYERRVPYYRNPNVVEGASNVATGALDTAGAALPWNWGRERQPRGRRYDNRQYYRQRALDKRYVEPAYQQEMARETR